MFSWHVTQNGGDVPIFFIIYHQIICTHLDSRELSRMERKYVLVSNDNPMTKFMKPF